MLGFSSIFRALVAIALLPSALGISLRSLEAMEYQSVMAGGQLNCVIEAGFDFVGHDISNAPGPVESCCELCSSVTNCAAWSWSNNNGGTCYFKSARGQVVSSPSVTSALFFRGQVAFCMLEQDVDYVGNDIGSVISTKPEACCSVCQKWYGCRAYTWNGDNGGTCYLKSKGGQKIAKTGVKSALAYPVGTEDCPAQEKDIDYVGNDLENKPSASADGCCAICQTVKNCNAYSWSNQSGGTCYLKTAKTGTIAKTGVVSAQLNANPSAKCDWERGVDYIGSDIGNVLGPVESCCGKCSEFLGCRAYSWTNYNGGTCWLKSNKGQTAANAGVISSVVYY